MSTQSLTWQILNHCPLTAAQDTPLLPPGTIHTESVHLYASAQQCPAAQCAHSRAPFCTAHAPALLPLAPCSGRTRAVAWPGTVPLSNHKNFCTAPVHPSISAMLAPPQPLNDSRQQRTEAQVNQRSHAHNNIAHAQCSQFRCHPPCMRSVLSPLRHLPRMRSSRPTRLPVAPPDGAAALPPPPPERGPRRSRCGAAGPGWGRRGGRVERARGGRRHAAPNRPLLSYPSAGRGAWRRPRDGGVRRRHRAVSTGRAGPRAGEGRRRRPGRSWAIEGGRAGGGAPRHRRDRAAVGVALCFPRRSLPPFPRSRAGRPSGTEL